MAVYVVDHTTQAAMLASIKAAFVAAGIVTTEHYYASDYYIVTTTRSAKVLKIRVNNSVEMRLEVYVGDAYTSGSTITNQLSINVVDWGPGPLAGAVIVSGDVVALAEVRTTGACFGAVLANVNSVTGENIIVGYRNSSGGGVLERDLTNDAQIFLPQFNRPVISAGDKYYQTEQPVTDGTYHLLGTGIVGIKQLLRPASSAIAYEINGDDVLLPMGYTGGGLEPLPMWWLIEDGNSWTPTP